MLESEASGTIPAAALTVTEKALAEAMAEVKTHPPRAAPLSVQLWIYPSQVMNAHKA